MIRLLLVEDDETLGETLTERLCREGYDVKWVATQKDAEAEFARAEFSLIVLDVGLPDGSGFDFARFVKASKPTPFLFITAMNTAEYRLEGYEIGAEEFVPKPFHLKELLIRIRHVLETHAPKDDAAQSSKNPIVCADRWIDMEGRAVITAEGGREFLAARDFELLKLLIEAAPRVLSRDRILDSVWGEDRFPTTRTVDNAIVRLRQALGSEGGRWIRSVRGIGYQWIAPEVGIEEESP